MYADDLVILAISINDLQCLVNLCVSELGKINMLITANKYSCIKIGRRFNTLLCSINVNDIPIP